VQTVGRHLESHLDKRVRAEAVTDALTTHLRMMVVGFGSTEQDADLGCVRGPLRRVEVPGIDHVCGEVQLRDRNELELRVR
jgi:hypothetical protein